jgi:serine/threonine protein kinase
MCGTTEYLAPEVLFREGHGKTVDWWTLGAIIYEMYFGCSPFYSQKRNEVIENIKYANLTFSENKQSKDFQDLL